MKKAFFAVIAVTAMSMSSAHASGTTPSLKGYICVDQKGVHHTWHSAFDGTTFCKLIPNPDKH